MSLKELRKNQQIANSLSGILSSNHVVHAFLFVGGSREDRMEIGREFSKALLCSAKENDSCGNCLSCRKFDDENHEDFIFIEKPGDKSSVGVDQIGELQKKLILKPFGDKYVVLLADAENLTVAAQNKLLKTLEEPSSALLILLSDNKDALLSTVRSRCQIYYLDEPENEEDETVSLLADNLLSLMRDSAPYYRQKAVLSELLSSKDAARENALAFLDLLEQKIAKSLSEDFEKMLAAADALAAARKEIRQGENVAYSLKQMCLKVLAQR